MNPRNFKERSELKEAIIGLLTKEGYVECERQEKGNLFFDKYEKGVRLNMARINVLKDGLPDKDSWVAIFAFYRDGKVGCIRMDRAEDFVKAFATRPDSVVKNVSAGVRKITI